jgi:hypothetical protein
VGRAQIAPLGEGVTDGPTGRRADSNFRVRDRLLLPLGRFRSNFRAHVRLLLPRGRIRSNFRAHVRLLLPRGRIRSNFRARDRLLQRDGQPAAASAPTRDLGETPGTAVPESPGDRAAAGRWAADGL